MSGYDAIALMIRDRLRRPNPIVGATLTADLGLNNDTPVVSVEFGGATRRAVYLPPHAPVVGGPVFVCRAGHDLSAPIVCVASNYQVSSDGVWGTGARGWGSGSGQWGA